MRIWNLGLFSSMVVAPFSFHFLVFLFSQMYPSTLAGSTLITWKKFQIFKFVLFFLGKNQNFVWQKPRNLLERSGIFFFLTRNLQRLIDNYWTDIFSKLPLVNFKVTLFLSCFYPSGKSGHQRSQKLRAPFLLLSSHFLCLFFLLSGSFLFLPEKRKWVRKWVVRNELK